MTAQEITEVEKSKKGPWVIVFVLVLGAVLFGIICIPGFAQILNGTGN
jgi:hypothetical protein